MTMMLNVYVLAAVAIAALPLLVQATAKNASACYGTNPVCDFYTLQCDAGQVIRLNKLYVGAKNETLCQDTFTHCDDVNTCCVYVENDVVESFDLANTYYAFLNCSGRETCVEKQAPWQLMTSSNSTIDTSTFINVEYVCEPVLPKYQLCGGYSFTSLAVTKWSEIIFDGIGEAFDPRIESKACHCSIVNSVVNTPLQVTFTVIDLRLEIPFKGVNDTAAANCSSAAFSSDFLTTNCVESSEPHVDNFHYHGNFVPVVKELAVDAILDLVLSNIFENGSNDVPAMLWVEIKADDFFKITCDETVKYYPTTTTTSTPSTTTTTQASTPAAVKAVSKAYNELYVVTFVPIGALGAFLIIALIFVWRRAICSTNKAKR